MTPVWSFRARYGGCVTEPGETLHAPIKVVPIYFDPIDETIVEAEPAASAPAPTPDAPTRRSGLVGGLSVVAAVVSVVLTGIGVGVASSGGYDAGTVIAWVSIVISAVAVLGGLVAIVLGRGRAAGVVAVILGVFANPWVLASLLGMVVPA